MLRPMSSGGRSPLGFRGDPVPCVQCDRREAGLAWGDFCQVCRAEREARVRGVAQRAGIVAAVALAAWLIWRSPNELFPRIFAAASVLLLYVIVRRLVARLMLEFLPREDRRRPGDREDGPPPGAPAPGT
jgi:hypothetical protein